MRAIFIAGSADGLGRMAAQRLIAQGHDVRTPGRGQQRMGVQSRIARST